ncbi:uncharacterized protein F5147DRAFT_768379 [Suillus discolor]|uniref:Uncharacterized protein n=1 Tax=Suillus discolor TaxID=1912936 RepID=A0A9P7JYX8_9AGAM|nr:uncharacterized protein F5147DRAFT_768379 [Suillus discolor]KAG2116992.1 hypothetical protein F5147DRAFT_768379 [Suillus discolor]
MADSDLSISYVKSTSDPPISCHPPTYASTPLNKSCSDRAHTIRHNLALMFTYDMGVTYVKHYSHELPSIFRSINHINALLHLHFQVLYSKLPTSHVEDWGKASGTERRQIFKAAAREARLLAPKMDQELLKQRKEKYRQWFHNYKKHKANAKAPMKLQKKWTARRVIEEQHKADILQQIHEEIEDETGQKPEQKEIFRRYQPTMTAIMKGLGDNELEEARAKADEWTNQAPDPAVQAKTARKKGEKMIKHFTKEMFTQASMRLFVLGSWKDEKGGLLTSGQVDTVGRSVILLTWFGRFDFNEHLGIGSSFMKCKDWQVILPAWEDFIGDAFNQDQDQDGTLLGGTRRVPKPYHEFDLDRMGLPMLPDIEGVSLDAKKGMIRSFLTIHYRKPVDRKPAASSDAHRHRNMMWKAKGPSALERHNEGTIMDPSKLQWNEANTLLECWLDRQDNQVGLTLKFKAWIDDKGKMRAPVSKESDDSNGDADDEGMWPMPTKKSSAAAAPSPAGVPKVRPRFIKRAHVSSANEESDKTDADVPLPKVNKHAPYHASVTPTGAPALPTPAPALLDSPRGGALPAPRKTVVWTAVTPPLAL